jgi:hypothetical protein
MTYPLDEAMAVNKEDLECIQTPVLPIVIYMLGLHCKLPVVICHNAKEVGGLALIDLCTELSIKTLKYFHNAIYSPSAAGNLILLNICSKGPASARLSWKFRMIDIITRAPGTCSIVSEDWDFCFWSRYCITRWSA